jgi:hypothetical protein
MKSSSLPAGPGDEVMLPTVRADTSLKYDYFRDGTDRWGRVQTDTQDYGGFFVGGFVINDTSISIQTYLQAICGAIPARFNGGRFTCGCRGHLPEGGEEDANRRIAPLASQANFLRL